MRLEDALQQQTFRSEFEKAVVNVLYSSNWLEQQHVPLYKAHGLTLQQYNILRILRGQYPNPATVNLLIDRMLDKQSNASRLVEKLRQKNLLERKICEKDRRRVDVVITQQGLDLLNQLDDRLAELHETLNVLTPEEAAQLNALLDKLRTHEAVQLPADFRADC